MGSIADLLGSQLPDDWQQKVTGESESETAGGAEESGTHATVVEAVLDETGYAPEAMSPDLRLAEDLELTGLPLWSVVAHIERELKVTFPDAQVRQWVTLGDLLNATSSS